MIRSRHDPVMGRLPILATSFARPAVATVIAGCMLTLCAVGSGNLLAQERGAPNLVGTAEILYSTDGGETYSSQPPVIATRQVKTVDLKLEFAHARPDPSAGSESYSSLTFDFVGSPLTGAIALQLNGRKIPLPLDGMEYHTVPGIDPGLLNQGQNILIVSFTVRNRSRDGELVFAPKVTLTPLAPTDLEFQTGPVLGAFDEGFFTLTCRTNMPARVSVYAWNGDDAGEAHVGQIERGERLAWSEPGLLHRIRVPLRPSLGSGRFAVLAERDGFSIGTTLRAPVAPDGPFSFLVLGDSRTNVEIWGRVASAAIRAAADAVLAVHVGDMVTLGTRDWEWDAQFWRPGRSLLNDLPFYPVIGNHEANAPLYDALFFGPAEDGGARNWAQELGGVLLIGIDGAQDWTEGSANAAWLEDKLSRSEARFAFVFSHYPAWSSAGHGRLGDDGTPRERPSREARDVIIPMLARHGAIAYIAGHDHAYERSELPGGVTGVTCGGAGAPLYEKANDAARQNPYSEVFATRHHFCLFDVGEDEVTMRVLSVDGETIDSRIWGAARD